jgi:hypothetical protein
MHVRVLFKVLVRDIWIYPTLVGIASLCLEPMTPLVAYLAIGAVTVISGTLALLVVVFVYLGASADPRFLRQAEKGPRAGWARQLSIIELDEAEVILTACPYQEGVLGTQRAWGSWDDWEITEAAKENHKQLREAMIHTRLLAERTANNYFCMATKGALKAVCEERERRLTISTHTAERGRRSLLAR